MTEDVHGVAKLSHVVAGLVDHPGQSLQGKGGAGGFRDFGRGSRQRGAGARRRQASEVGGNVVIVLEFPDTQVIRTLVLPGIDLRLYECEGGGRGLSTRGRRRGGAVAATAHTVRGQWNPGSLQEAGNK